MSVPVCVCVWSVCVWSVCVCVCVCVCGLFVCVWSVCVCVVCACLCLCVCVCVWSVPVCVCACVCACVRVCVCVVCACLCACLCVRRPGRRLAVTAGKERSVRRTFSLRPPWRSSSGCGRSFWDSFELQVRFNTRTNITSCEEKHFERIASVCSLFFTV